jgi:small nuclear ribonucleoprotein (snRNP)-like protein
VGVVVVLPERLHAQELPPRDSLVAIELNDGTTFRGKIVRQDETTVVLVTLGGTEVQIPRSSIVSIKAMRGRMVDGVFRRFDPNYSRLIFAPTGRPLRRGDGYFSDFYVVFPSVAYGLTDNLSIMAGMSVIPGVSLTEQLMYVAPRVGVRPSDDIALSAGVLYASIMKEGDAAGIAFAVGTFGREDRSFSAGIGLGYTKTEGQDFAFADRPIIMLGGNVRLSNSVALVSENWLITGADFDLGRQPFAVALRLFGEHIAVDVGAILIGEALAEGLPIPLLSFVYNFGG